MCKQTQAQAAPHSRQCHDKFKLHEILLDASKTFKAADACTLDNLTDVHMVVVPAHLGTRAVIHASESQQHILDNQVDQAAAGSQICLLTILSSLVGSTEHCSSLEQVPDSLLHCFLLLLCWQASVRLLEMSIALHPPHTRCCVLVYL